MVILILTKKCKTKTTIQDQDLDLQKVLTSLAAGTL